MNRIIYYGRRKINKIKKEKIFLVVASLPNWEELRFQNHEDKFCLSSDSLTWSQTFHHLFHDQYLKGNFSSSWCVLTQIKSIQSTINYYRHKCEENTLLTYQYSQSKQFGIEHSLLCKMKTCLCVYFANATFCFYQEVKCSWLWSS